MTEYTGMSAKGEGRSQVFAQIVGEMVEVRCRKSSGLTVSFDKKPTQILKRDVHIPEFVDVDVSELVDYPPRLLIYVKQTDNSSSVSPPEVQVIGLDRECSFELPLLCTPQSALKQHAEGKKGIYETAALASALLGNFIEEDSILGIDDLKDVLDAVETLSSQWSLLTTKLGVKQSSLDIIKHNHPGDAKMCLYEALGEWLRLNYDHQRHGRPSWRKLVEAVRSLDCGLSERITETWKQRSPNVLNKS